MFYTYLLQSKRNGKLYTGYTNDLKRRLSEHNQGLNVSTKPSMPWKVIYYEACMNQRDAMRREKYFKTTHGKRLLKRRLKEFFHDERNI